MKRILLTGSNGLLGQKIVKLVQDEYADRYELLATSKGANRIEKIKGFDFQSLDISDPKAVAELFDSYRPDYLINTAAMTNVDACEDDKEGCKMANIEAVKILGEACEKHNTFFLHLSTDFIFDGEDGPYKEDDKPNPLSYYGWSKLEGEKVVESLSCPWAIARTIIVYGVAEQMSRSNIVLWAKSALEKGDPLTIVNDQFRSPTLAEDLAKGCMQIIEHDAQGVYHLSGKDFMSIIELVKRVAKHFGLNDAQLSEISSSSLNQAAKRPPKTGFVLDKAMNDLGYDPHSFEEGLSIVDQQIQQS
ncbi:MAG: NAD(P)-dependent oxidoreductase [Flavobacteriales bacterium]|nr:NAD(P)-dependent oxidoreductase [Flavobacteriales bacterium]